MSGRAWVFGDDIDTDMLAPGLYMKSPIAELASHCLEAIDPEFASRVRPGDVLVAGRNFGMGSSREQAAQALKQLGVQAVLARSFGGIFYRNAFNLGLPALVCAETARIKPGERLQVDPRAGSVTNSENGETLVCEPVPGHLVELVEAGGLVAYLERRLQRERR